MLLRASKRSLPQDVYKQTAICLEGLRLPFLCPILLKQPRASRNTSTVTQPQSKLSRKSHGNKHIASQVDSQKRRLASAAAVDYVPQHDTYVPWESPRSREQVPSSRSNELSMTNPRAFDPNFSPIIIKDSLSTRPKKFRVKDAISGDINEIHQTLHACLQVGRLERAAALVRRLNEIYRPDAPGLLAAHKEYMSELTHRIAQTKDQRLLRHLQRWFQVDVKDIMIEPDETIHAMMIRASLHAVEDKRDRTIRRYVNIAKESGLGQETEAVLSYHDEDSVPILRRYFHEEGKKGKERPIEESETIPEIFDSAYSQPGETIDDVRAMDLKGLGLSTLKKSLSIFSDQGFGKSKDGMELPPDERQRLLEIHTVNAAVDRWREEDAHLRSLGINSSLSTSTIGAIMWKWHEQLAPLIKEDIHGSKTAEKKEKRSQLDIDRLKCGPFLQSLPAEKISAVAILSAMKIMGTDSVDGTGVRLHNLVRGIGEGIQNESIATAVRNNKADKNGRALSAAINGRSNYQSLRNLVRMSASQEYAHLEWTTSTQVLLGAFLFSRLMDIAKVQVSRKDPRSGVTVQEFQPVFFHTFRYIAGKRVGIVRLNATMMEKFANVPVASALAKYLPMVCEPNSWTGYCEGGFLESPLPVVRINAADKQSKRYAVTAAENGDMDQVFAGLNVLAKTRWRINRFVFDTMLEAWNSGKAIAKIPPENVPEANIPEPPSTDDAAARYKWDSKVRGAENYRLGLRSQRCFQNFQLEVARAYLDETFYFPHNCDFRGRAYPMTPFLNHMGSDNVRGLLTFGQGKELTPDGLWWLKVHLANVYGYDKASFTERMAFTEAHLIQIRDSVDRPLTGDGWWLTAEDPWQCLAACKELKDALDLPDPTKYICHLPIHQDGTCNGLQHYAALGGDVAGARQVNLEPGGRPSDIYTAVAELVKAEISQDAARGSPLAKVLDGKVTRKVVKQTVMTNVYGVTFTGAKRQVRKQLDDLLISFPDSYEVNVVAAAPYIAKKIFAALATMFNGAHDIQYWLTDSAARISESFAPDQVAQIQKVMAGETLPVPFRREERKPIAVGRPAVPTKEITEFKSTVIWTTPLKMPVVQPYHKKTRDRVDTTLQKITIMNRTDSDPVDKIKQVQAFPPNFIHSLDATHMFLTALKCNEVGLTFASIHDSFWTHAGDVNTMNRIIRDAFIKMHSEDIVGRLAAEFRTRYKGYMHQASVRHDTPLAKKILAWRRKISKDYGTPDSNTKVGSMKARKMDELLLERRRLDLLASEDRKDREEGEQMITPGKLFADAAGGESLATESFNSATIGLKSTSRSAKLKANRQIAVGDLENAEPAKSKTADEAASFDESDPGESDIEASVSSAEACDDTVDEAEDPEESSEVHDKPKATTKTRARKIWVWLPLTFPPVPKKVCYYVLAVQNSLF